MDSAVANGFRFRGGETGHYESWFTRANHPTRALAFWIRYTVFVPRGRARDAVGELWAIHFDGESSKITAVKEVVPFARCTFASHGLDVRVGDSTLDATHLVGRARTSEHAVAWDLAYASKESPLLLLPPSLYDAGFPKAKALVPAPLARFDGSLVVDDTRVSIDGWMGSQNHNWGERHTDAYAWGQVAGFDDAPRSFLELSTARVKIGPLTTPPMTLLVLRHDGREHRLSSITQSLRAKGSYDFFRWDFRSETRDVGVEGHIDARASDFVGLPYDNPPGGRKTCVNSKIARCELRLTVRGAAPVTLRTANRAAFEILTDRTDHGVPVLRV